MTENASGLFAAALAASAQDGRVPGRGRTRKAALDRPREARPASWARRPACRAGREECPVFGGRRHRIHPDPARWQSDPADQHGQGLSR